MTGTAPGSTGDGGRWFYPLTYLRDLRRTLEEGGVTMEVNDHPGTLGKQYGHASHSTPQRNTLRNNERTK